MIIPSIDIQNGRAVQLRQGKEIILDGGDPVERLEEFSTVGEVAVIDLDAAMGVGSNRELIFQMCRRHPVRVGGGIRSKRQAEYWINAGASKIILGTAATPELCGSLPRERVMAAVDAVAGEVVVEGWKTRTAECVLDRMEALSPFVSGFLLTQVEFEGGLGGFDRGLIDKALVVSNGVRVTAAGGIRDARDIRQLDAIGVDTQVGMALYSGRISLGQSVSSVLQKPIDGRFWPTVVTDDMGSALGLVWSTAESLERAIEEKRGVYWSRSRDQIWRKGDTSGNTQELIRVELDCDRDSLRFTVRQHGPFCHTNTRSCWGNPFDLGTLERVLAQRVQERDPESGTVLLLNNPSLLKEKLIEEAGELADAASSEAVTLEAADLLYFLMVSLTRSGQSLDSVVAELGRRNQRVQRRAMESKGSTIGTAI